MDTKNMMKQPQLFNVNVYLKIHLNRIKARDYLSGRAACSRSLLTSWAFFYWGGSPSNWKLSLLECLWPARRGISSPVSTVLGTGAFFASTSPEDPRTLPELALFCTCKQTIINCKYWVFRSLTCSAQRQVHLLHQESHQTHRSPAVSSWARRAAVVLPIGSDFLRLLEYYFLQPSEYRFLICQIIHH